MLNVGNSNIPFIDLSSGGDTSDALVMRYSYADFIEINSSDVVDSCSVDVKEL